MSNSGKKMKISFNSPVILGFTLICLAALILNFFTGGLANLLFFSVYRSPMFAPLSYFRLIGHVFGHANWSHFIGNITLILVVGPLLEEKYGSKKMMLVIFVTAIVTGLANIILFPHIRLLGASGVVFALILLASFASIQQGEIPLTFILVAILYIGGEIIDGIFVQDNISHLTHILGGGVGASLGFKLNRK